MSFNKATMLGVVRHYAEQRRQDMMCLNCRFIPWNEEEQTTPDGFEPMRDYPYFVKQCDEHNVPRFPFLQDADENKAAEWLVNESGAEGKPFMIRFDEWEKALKLCETCEGSAQIWGQNCPRCVDGYATP